MHSFIIATTLFWMYQSTVAGAFVTFLSYDTSRTTASAIAHRHRHHCMSSIIVVEEDPGAIHKAISEEGDGDHVQDGDEVQISYTGTIAGQGENWSPAETVTCWLQAQQGLDYLSEGFLSQAIDGEKLANESFFNEEFLTTELEVSNKIQAKKLCMATKRLRTQRQDYAVGTEFESGSMSFKVGAGKMIRGMELAVATMKVGESAKATIRCDYAYGSDGFRKRNGDVVVPPFASLCFDITVIKT